MVLQINKERDNYEYPVRDSKLREWMQNQLINPKRSGEIYRKSQLELALNVLTFYDE